MSAKAAVLKGDGSAFSTKQYVDMEEEYVKEARMILLEKGCKNAGITLTYITDREGQREYSVTVHHRKLTRMNVTEWNLLQARVREAGQSFLSGNGKIMVKILSDI